MSIPRKLTLITLAFILPVSVMIFLIVSGINDSIQFSRFETYGNRYQRPLMALLRDIPLYSLAVDEESESASALAQQISSTLQSLDLVDKEIGANLQFTSEGLGKRGRTHLTIANLRSTWERLVNTRISSQRNKELVSIMDLIRGMIIHAGDTSNLILDPDLDSYYLMDVTLLALPQSIFRRHEIARELSQVYASQNGTMKIHVWRALAEESDFKRVTTSMQTALNEDPNFYGLSSTLLPNITPSLEDYRKAEESFLNELAKLATGSGSVTRVLSSCAESQRSSFVLWNTTVSELDQLLNTRIADYKSRRINSLLLTALSLAVALFLVFFIQRGISRSLSSFMAMFRIAGSGDLTPRYSSSAKSALRDEIDAMGEIYNSFIGSYVSDLTQLRTIMDTIRSLIQGLAASSQETSATSSEQAAAVKEIVSTMEDVDSLSKSIEKRIREITTISENTHAVVRGGFDRVQDTLGKMNEINQANQTTIEGIRFLSEKIENIWDIVNMINGIADQTRIIAFNAELEASAAGEAGRNFQIVATEIRRLADSTVRSTGEIKDRITEIQKSSDRLILTSETGTEKIREGNRLTSEIRELFDTILTSADTSSDSTRQIGKSINQQVVTFEQILIAIRQISEGVDHIATAIRGTASASDDLRSISDRIAGILKKYTLS